MGQLTLVICAIPVLNAKVISVQLHIQERKNELVLDKVPDDSARRRQCALCQSKDENVSAEFATRSAQTANKTQATNFEYQAGLNNYLSVRVVFVQTHLTGNVEFLPCLQ